jgi:glycerophosphoryl diester phosphodiesterase
MFSWLAPPRKPILVAHRGSSATAPENTLAAFRQAIEDGADAVELDLHLTKDGHLVVIHDTAVQRTTNGRGKVSEKTLRELKQLDCGSWFHRKFTGERIPTLQEVFELLRGELGINIEIKPSYRSSLRIDIVEECLKVIEEFKAWKTTMISSFQHSYVRRAKLLDSRVIGGVLYHPVKHYKRTPLQLTLQTHAEYFICGKRLLRRRILRDVQEHGITLGVYTVNTEKSFLAVQRLGIDCIFSDRPSLIARLRERSVM